MTADYIQRKEAGRRLRLSLLPKALRREGSEKSSFGGLPFQWGGLELVRRDGSKPTNAVNDARFMIEKAEKKLAEQGSHIRELEETALSDPMTGLLNRRGFVHAFNRELGRTSRGHNKGGLLLLIDVQNLKNINHVYGLRAGDSCLKLIAQVLKNEIRAMDAAAFIGGDEFVLLLPNAEKERAVERAQKLALRLNNLSFIWRETEIPISAALGLKGNGPGDLAETMFRKDGKNTTANKGAEARA